MSCESEPPISSGEPLPGDVHVISGTGAPPEPHLPLPPAVSPNVASVVPPIPPISSASLFVESDPFVVVDHAPNHLKTQEHHGTQNQPGVQDTHGDVPGDDTHHPQDDTIRVSVGTAVDEGNTVEDAHHEPQQLNQQIEDPAYSHQHHQLQDQQLQEQQLQDQQLQDQQLQEQQLQEQQLQEQQLQEPQHPTAFNDPSHPDLQATVVPMSDALPTVSQEMNQIPVSLSGAGVDTSVPMVTVASESVGMTSVNVSGAMSTDIYTSTAGSVVVSAAQLTNTHSTAPFSGMEYMATDQPHQQMEQIEGPPEHPTENSEMGQNFGVEAAPKLQVEAVSIVAALPEAEVAHAPVPIVTSAQAPVVMPNTAVNVAIIPGHPEMPFGGETVDKCVECEVCGSLFGDAGSLRRHAARAHRAATGKGPVYCPHCTAALKNEQNLRRHIAVCHSGSQENRCNMCSASFGSRGSLRIHQQSVHSLPSSSKGGRSKGITKPKAEKSFLCDMCTDTFKWKGNLKRHRKLRHLQERPFTCKICHASFGTKSNMGVHYITHQNSGTIPTPAVATVPQAANSEVPVPE